MTEMPSREKNLFVVTVARYKRTHCKRDPVYINTELKVNLCCYLSPCRMNTSIQFYTTNFYRPQTKFAKVMFLHLSVSHSVHRGESTWAGTPPGRYTPQAGTSPWQVHPPGNVCWDMVNKRAVRILLECILVYRSIYRSWCPAV